MQQLKWFCLCLCFSCGSNRFHKLGCTQYAMHTQACSYNTKVNRHQSVMNKSKASAITFTRYFSSANFMSKANHSNKSQRNWCKVVHVPKNWYFWPNVGNNGKMCDNSYHSVHFKKKPFHEHLWCCIKQWPLPKGIFTIKDKIPNLSQPVNLFLRFPLTLQAGPLKMTKVSSRSPSTVGLFVRIFVSRGQLKAKRPAWVMST